MDSKQQKTSGRRQQKLLLLVLLVITVTAVAVTVWALFFRTTASAPVLAPDYAPVEEEANAEPVSEESEEKLEAAEGGGAVSLTYSGEVTISLQRQQASLLFANPGKSTQDMVLQLLIDDTVLLQSGTLKPGRQVTALKLIDGAADRLEEGGYDGRFVVFYYDPDSGEKAVINTEIPVTITVAP